VVKGGAGNGHLQSGRASGWVRNWGGRERRRAALPHI